ncbi:hypothetical protein [Kovacikia minuta]|nr:hypothetical protein [Kovacikia minuta]
MSAYLLQVLGTSLCRIIKVMPVTQRCLDESPPDCQAHHSNAAE